MLGNIFYIVIATLTILIGANLKECYFTIFLYLLSIGVLKHLNFSIHIEQDVNERFVWIKTSQI